jgi:hypothetical protein
VSLFNLSSHLSEHARPCATQWRLLDTIGGCLWRTELGFIFAYKHFLVFLK